MAAIYLTLIAELEFEMDPRLLAFLKALCQDLEARFGVPRTKPWTRYMDDKWLFHPSYLRQVANNIGLKLDIVAPIYKSIQDIFSRSVRISLHGAGLGGVPVSAKFWEIIDQFDVYAAGGAASVT